MKTSFTIACRLVLLSVIAMLVAFGAQAQNSFKMKSVEASIHGTSSLHDWKSAVTQVECTGSFLSTSKTLQSMKNVKVKIAVKGIKSTEGKTMDHKTYQAFDSDKNPTITYAFTDAKIVMDHADSATITTSGNLTMAGTSRLIDITAKGKMLANGDLQFSFSKKLKMTDYKMKPPTAVLGTIKVGDEITLSFNMILAHSL